MEQHIKLDVPEAMKAYAKSHGALYTAGFGWWVLQSIYDNTPQLWEFAREGPRILSKLLRPTCPRPECGSSMLAIPNPASGDYWRCRLRSCNGSRPLGDPRIYFQALIQGRDMSDPLNKAHPEEYLKILESTFFGTGLHVTQWFLTAKRALRGKTPEMALSKGNNQRSVTELFIRFARDWLD